MSEAPVISIVDDDFSVREAMLGLVRAMGFIGCLPQCTGVGNEIALNTYK